MTKERGNDSSQITLLLVAQCKSCQNSTQYGQTICLNNHDQQRSFNKTIQKALFSIKKKDRTDANEPLATAFYKSTISMQSCLSLQRFSCQDSIGQLNLIPRSHGEPSIAIEWGLLRTESTHGTPVLEYVLWWWKINQMQCASRFLYALGSRYAFYK